MPPSERASQHQPGQQQPRDPATARVGCAVIVAVGGLLAWSYFAYPRGTMDQPEPAAAEPEAIFVAAPVTFAPGLHLLGALSPSVAYAIETSDGLILVDTGLEDGHALLVEQLEALGLDINDLKMILVTHGHGDHYLGAKELQETTGAKLYVGKGDSGVLRDAGPREAVFSTFAMDNVGIHPTVVDVELTGGETIELGDTRIQVIATPGHTPGSVCYLLDRDGRTALFSGDTIMTITGDLGTYATYLSPRYRGNPVDYLATLRTLATIPVPDLLLPGHPRTSWRTVNARISPDDWSSLLDRGIQEMEQLTTRYATDGEDFLDGTPRELLPGLYYLGDHAGIAVFCFREASSVILIDAPGGSELVDFLEARLGEFNLDLSLVTAVVVTDPAPESNGGLAAVEEKTACRVIASESAWDEIRAFCPSATLLNAEEAEAVFGWLPLEPISVRGFDGPRAAFVTQWQEKQILLSGRTPLKITTEVMKELDAIEFDPARFQPALLRLQVLQPDLWLPSRPVHGQNANLYGTDWQEILRQNRLSLGM